MNDQIDPTMFTLSSSAAGEQWYSHAMEGLVEVVQDLSLARDLATVMEIVRRAARALTGADGATFVLRDGDQCYYAAEDAISPLWLGRRFPMSICISGWVMRNKQPAVIEDVFADSRIPTEAYRPTFVRSLAMVPIRTRDPVGAIGNYWATQYQPDPHQVKVLQALADTTAVALENVRGYGALEEKIKDMAVLTQAAPVPILTLDPEGAVQSWNPAAERLFGFSAAQSLGCPLSGFDAESANDLKRILNNIRAGREVRGDVLKGQQATGAPIDLRVSGAPVPGENGALRAILLVVVDETERNRLERQFLQSQKMEAVGQLTGGISHDFNNLLGILIGNLDLLHDRLAQDSESLELVDAALDAGLRGADLNKRLLAFSRRQALQPEQVDVNAAIIGMMKLLRRSLGARVDVRLACGDDIWPVKVDPVQFETAVVNLSLNARDAMPLGGVLTVETANAQLDEAYAACHAELEPGDYVMVAVTDTGTGMTPEVLSRAFDPFFTTKPVGQGTGLGLSMIYGFMKQSGGHTNIYSEPGQGTTVRLYLPRLKEEGSKQAVLAAVPLPPLADHDVVLVVEDNPDMRRIAMRQLTDLGYQVVEAENGERALALITEGFRPDLLFTDVIMPGALDGIALADKVRAHLPGLPVVLSSGFTERTALDIRERDGRPITYALLSKPYRKDDLARIMRSALDAGKLGKTETPS